MGMFGPEGQIPEQDRFGWPHRLGNAVAPKRESCSKQDQMRMSDHEPAGMPEPKPRLTPEAERALAEAEERRRLADAERAAHPRPEGDRRPRRSRSDPLWRLGEGRHRLRFLRRAAFLHPHPAGWRLS